MDENARISELQFRCHGHVAITLSPTTRSMIHRRRIPASFLHARMCRHQENEFIVKRYYTDLKIFFIVKKQRISYAKTGCCYRHYTPHPFRRVRHRIDSQTSERMQLTPDVPKTFSSLGHPTTTDECDKDIRVHSVRLYCRVFSRKTEA